MRGLLLLLVALVLVLVAPPASGFYAVAPLRKSPPHARPVPFLVGRGGARVNGVRVAMSTSGEEQNGTTGLQEEPRPVEESNDLAKSIDFRTPQPLLDAGDDQAAKFRIVAYIVLSLIPCLLLLPLMSSNTLQPLDPEIMQEMMRQ